MSNKDNSPRASVAAPHTNLCPYCEQPMTFHQSFYWRCNTNNCGYQEGTRSSEPWRDEGGHEWEIRHNVTCVECPHCCFMFAAVHGNGDSDGYSCPNCDGCPDAKDAATPSTSSAIRAAAEEILQGAQYPGRDEDIEKIVTILSRYFGKGETEDHNDK